MFKSKKTIFIGLGILILLLFSAGFWWFKNKNQEPDWNNPDYVFDVGIPADFDEYKIERLNEKIAQARQAYQDNPEDNYTWVIIGDMYQFARDYNKALLVYYKAHAIQPLDVSAILNIAVINEDYLDPPNYQEAEKFYAKGIAIFPQILDPYNRLAELYWHKMNRLEDAETIYLQAVDATGQSADAFIRLISFYKRTDQIDKQKIYTANFLELYPNNEQYQKDWGYILE